MSIDTTKIQECEREIDLAIANIAFALTATVEQLNMLNRAYNKAKGVLAGDDVPPL